MPDEKTFESLLKESCHRFNAYMQTCDGELNIRAHCISAITLSTWMLVDAYGETNGRDFVMAAFSDGLANYQKHKDIE